MLHDSTDPPIDPERFAMLRGRFLDPEQSGRDDGPSDCVRQIPMPNGMVCLVSFDCDGNVGPSLTIQARYALPSDMEWLLRRCRVIHPPRNALALLG